MLPRALRPYAKFVVAAIGIAGLIIMTKLDAQYPDLEALVMAIVRETLLGALVGFGVYRVRNDDLPPKTVKK